MEERGHHCIVLERGDHPLAQSLSFKVFSESDLDKAREYFDSQGIASGWVERRIKAAHCAPSIRSACRSSSIFNMDKLNPIHQQYKLYRGVKPLRIDHFNCYSDDVETSVDFYNSLGFRITEYTEAEESGQLWAVWMHRKGGIHDIAFTSGYGPRLHHVAFWVPTPLNIIDLLDLMSTTGYLGNIERGPGRHGISNAFFLYVRDPTAIASKSIARII
jgi:catechol 2,3-dioxygenase